MLKLSFIYQSQQVETATIGHKEVGVLKVPKLLREQLKTVVDFCAEAVKMVWAIADETEICLLNLYNFLTQFDSEDSDGHRGSGRILNRSRAINVFSLAKDELVPG